MLQDFGTRGILGNSTTIQNKESVEGKLGVQQDIQIPLPQKQKQVKSSKEQ